MTGRPPKATHRVFLAVFPPASVQAAAHEVTAALRRPDDRMSWVKRENLHYTMRFLGDLGADGERRAGEAAREAAAKHPPFDATLGAPGAFPNPRRARVVWLGLAAGAEALQALARDLESALRARGFERADKPFAAHLTLGRARDRDRDVSAALAGAVVAPASFRVGELLVVRSTLSPKGSIYETSVRAPLGGASPP